MESHSLHKLIHTNDARNQCSLQFADLNYVERRIFMFSFVFSLALSVLLTLSLLFCTPSLVSIKVVSIVTIGYQLDEH